MRSLSLNGEWTLYYCLENGEPLDYADCPHVPARVPGNVELDLVRAGVEEEPFFGENLYAFRKYEFYRWWYVRELFVPEDWEGEKLELCFAGLDDVADISVNGIEIGHAENMFIEHRFDVSDAILCGRDNKIVVTIHSAINHARQADYPMMCAAGERTDEYVRLRKAPHSFGWDIMPRMPSAGLWRGVTLEAVPPTRLTEVYIATRRADERHASLSVRYRCQTDAAILDDFAIRIEGACGESRFVLEKPSLFVSGTCTVEIDNPRLWWPRGYGEQPLYEVRVSLLYKGAVVDEKVVRTGIRKLEIVQKMAPGDEGEFLVKANGCPLLLKGSNWVPLDAFHSRDAERLQAAHDLLTDIGCNIVRCWGGNVYEDHAFFDLCDERGILVWQDFAMACALYPQDETFLNMIEAEATAVVKKLRNHPSILLWAGDNEVDEGYSGQDFATDENRYNKITREVLPNVVRMHDPYRAFIPSSPYIPAGMPRYSVPEQHNWGARAYFKDDFYKHTNAHFISECGYHGCPSPASLGKYIPDEELWPFAGSSAWMTHNTDNLLNGQRGYDRNQLMADQVQILFGETPDDLETFSILSQVSQAEAKKFFIERARIKKWRRTGIIWWNLIDGWPQISDAVVDYYYDKKRAYAAIKRVQNPICLMFDELTDWTHAVVLGNDGRESKTVAYRVVEAETGATVLAGSALSPANENVRLGEIRLLAGTQKLYLLYWTVDGVEYKNHYITGYPPFSREQMLAWLPLIDSEE